MRPFEPARIIECELERPLEAVTAVDEGTGRRYRRAVCLVRLHDAPLGLVEVRIDGESFSAPALAHAIWQRLGASIRAHLDRDGLPRPDGLPPDGLVAPDTPPRCRLARAEFLASAPPASVVVPTCARPALLERCLEALARLDYPSYEVVVVDNAPRAELAEPVVRRFAPQFLRLTYAREERAGQSWARNRGLELAASRLVAFVDDDAVPDRHWLCALVGAFAAAEDVGCVTGLILPLEVETRAQALLEVWGGFNKGFRRRVFDLGAHRSADPLYPYAAGMFGSGASMAFDAAVLRELGGFDPALGTGRRACGGEELSAFVRTLMSGHRLVYEPAAIVRHPHHRAYGRLRRQVFGYGIGLGAYLTSLVRDDPALAVHFVRRSAAGARHLIGARSRTDGAAGARLPRRLLLAQLLGVAAGPAAYVRGSRRARALARQARLCGHSLSVGS